jgi:hypothetical protein
VALKLYENVVIGNFLYGLGFSIASRIEEPSFPSMVNLFQQTPADKAIGDLIMRFPGVLRIIEFKQKENKDDKEPLRHKHLSEQLEQYPRRREISQQIHWFVETDPSEDTFVARIVPYLDAYPPTNKQHDLASFISGTADAAVKGEPISDEELDDYIKFIGTCHKSGAASAGGLVVKMSPSGDFAYVALKSMEELRLEPYRVLDARRKQEAQFVKFQEIALEQSRKLRQQEIERTQQKGWELDMGGR